MSAPYRSDIDGLRAISVLAVTGYHWKIDGFKGGFVGVDCFFVISGFLISMIISREIQAGNFSIVGFYERRIRRIVPALYAYIIAAAAVSALLFLPSDQRLAFRSGVAAILFGSNILFWLDSGYFAADALTRPLLQTWSLGVEEQFYLVFPWLLLILMARGAKATTIGTLGFLAASFAANLWVTEISAPTAFFLAPTRMWELLIGAALALAPLGPPRFKTAAGFLGLGLILFAVVAYSGKTLFPGIAAAAPVLGAALIIWSWDPADPSPVHRLLSLRPMVYVGKISYSFYLWHWGLIVFAKRVAPGFKGGWLILLFALLLALSHASFKWIETPIRSGRALGSRKSLFTAFWVATLGLIGLGVWGDLAGGIAGQSLQSAERFLVASQTKHPRAEACSNLAPERMVQGGACVFGAPVEPTALVWGDSHAFALLPGLEEAARREGRAFLYASADGCPPTDGSIWPGNDPGGKCRAFAKSVLDLAQSRAVASVILAARWNLYANTVCFGDTDPDLRDASGPIRTDAAAADALSGALAALVGRFGQMGAKVVIVDQVPDYADSVPRRLAENALWWSRSKDDWRRSAAEYARISANFNRVLDRIGPVRRIRLGDALCAGMVCAVEAEGQSLYMDGNHLSVFGAIRLAPALSGIFGG